MEIVRNILFRCAAEFKAIFISANTLRYISRDFYMDL